MWLMNFRRKIWSILSYPRSGLDWKERRKTSFARFWLSFSLYKAARYRVESKKIFYRSKIELFSYMFPYPWSLLLSNSLILSRKEYCVEKKPLNRREREFRRMGSLSLESADSVPGVDLSWNRIERDVTGKLRKEVQRILRKRSTASMNKGTPFIGKSPIVVKDFYPIRVYALAPRPLS